MLTKAHYRLVLPCQLKIGDKVYSNLTKWPEEIEEIKRIGSKFILRAGVLHMHVGVGRCVWLQTKERGYK